MLRNAPPQNHPYFDRMPAQLFAPLPVRIIPNNPTLANFMRSIQIGEAVYLCEVQNEQVSYWLKLEADTTPVAIIDLEGYIDHCYPNQPGRRCDFIAVGWHPNGDAYLVFLELRDVLISEEQWEDKHQQVLQSIEWFCRVASDAGLEHHRTAPPLFHDVCQLSSQHKIVGAIIPLNRSLARFKQHHGGQVEGWTITIIPLPAKKQGNPAYTWSELLSHFRPLDDYRRE